MHHEYKNVQRHLWNICIVSANCLDLHIMQLLAMDKLLSSKLIAFSVFVSDIHSLVEVWDSHKSKFESIGLIPVVDLLSPASECNTQCIVCHVNSRLCVEKGSYKIIIRSNQVRY